MQQKSKGLLRQEFTELINTTDVFVLLCDVNGKIIFLSQAWLNFTGLNSMNAEIEQVIHSDDRKFLTINPINNNPYNEFRVKTQQGNYHWFCSYRTTLFNSIRQPKGYLYQCFDIHNQKLHLEVIKAQEERYNFAVNSTGLGVWDLILEQETMGNNQLDEQHNKLIWNSNMFKIYNVDPKTFAGSYADFEKCVHPDDKQKVKDHIDKSFKDNAIFRTKFRIISHPGEIRFISAQAKATFNPNGKIIRLTGINQDITEIEEEKQEIIKLNKQISDDDIKYQALFEYSADAIMLLENNIFIECNEAAITMFACPDKKSFLNKHPSYFSPEKQADGRESVVAADEYIKSAYENGKAHFPWIHKRLTGQIFPAEVSLTPVYLKSKPILQATVRDTTELVRLQERLTFLSLHDQLTGLHNRNGFLAPFDKYIHQAKQNSMPLSLIMLDIDNFKNFNDSYGHQVGDKVLKSLANIISENSRPSDFCVRFGGDEFIILLPETSQKQALQIAANLRDKVEKSSIYLNNNKEIHYTTSIGVATYPENGSEQTSILNAVDKAMYRSKKSGKNQVSTFKD